MKTEGKSPVACAGTQALIPVAGEQGPRAVFLIRLRTSNRALAVLDSRSAGEGNVNLTLSVTFARTRAELEQIYSVIENQEWLNSPEPFGVCLYWDRDVLSYVTHGTAHGNYRVIIQVWGDDPAEVQNEAERISSALSILGVKCYDIV